MAEESDLDAGGKRRRPTARDIGLIAGREGARHALIPLGIDIDDSRSLERWHAERAYVRDAIRIGEERGKTFRKVTLTALLMAGFGVIGAWLKSTFHFGG